MHSEKKSPKRLIQWIEDLEIIHHPDYGTFEIGQNTEKSPGDLGQLAVPQTPVRNL